MDKIEKLDSLVSQYVRLRDSKPYGFTHFRCVACGRLLPIEEADAGHFVKRSNMATRFDEENIYAECRLCNRFLQGNYESFRENLVRKLGKEKVEELICKGRSTVKFSKSDIDEMIKTYKKKIKELK